MFCSKTFVTANYLLEYESSSQCSFKTQEIES